MSKKKQTTENPSGKPKKSIHEASAPTLTPEQTAEITAFIQEKQKEGIDRKEIRKLVHKEFEIDITVYEFKYPAEPEHVPVAKGKELAKKEDVPVIKQNIDYEHHFSDLEKNEISQRISSSIIERDELESRAKMVKKEYDSKIAAKDTEIKQLANQIKSGFEMRHGTANVIKLFTKGLKEFYIENKLVKTEALTAEDRQTALGDE